MSQVATRASSCEEHLRDPDFRRGYFDAWDGRPFRPGLGKSSEWFYERGRLFAVYVRESGGTFLPLKRGADLNPAAIRLLGHAFRDGSLL